MEGHMRRNSLKILTAVLATLLLLVGCINKGEEETTPPIDVSGVDKNSIGSYQTMQYQYLTNVDVSCLTTNLSSEYLILANKQNELESDYEPSSLTVLTCATAYSMKLDARAAQALYAMLAEMHAAGVTDITVTSAYRTYSKQVELYNGYVNKERSYISEEAKKVFGEDYIYMKYLEKGIYKLTLEDAHTVVQTYSALPGQSEHQTGLCIDFITSDMGGELNEAFEDTPAFAWLSQNAYKFGFILRYPQGTKGITGYDYEPWHYRFVGREAATDIHNGGMTLEQYLQLANQAQ